MEYTAIYSTNSMKGVQYSFMAENVKEAIKVASGKFSCYPRLAIIENDEESDDATFGRLVFNNGEVINGTYDVMFNDDCDSNNVGIHGSYSECLTWIENNRNDSSTYFGDYKGGTVSIICEELEEYVYNESI